MTDKLYLIAVGFAGATLGLLVAKYGFGASGVDRPETVAWVGFVLSFGAYITLRMRRDRTAR